MNTNIPNGDFHRETTATGVEVVAEVDILEVEVHRNNGSAPAAQTEASEERKWHYVTSVMLKTTITYRWRIRYGTKRGIFSHELCVCLLSIK